MAGRPVRSVVPTLTTTPGVAASTLYNADRTVGLISGFHSQLEACSNQIVAGLPRYLHVVRHLLLRLGEQQVT
jgi:hypothetical protein